MTPYRDPPREHRECNGYKTHRTPKLGDLEVMLHFGFLRYISCGGYGGGTFVLFLDDDGNACPQ
ncbi:MAG: hypothetical protein FWC50_06240 [Planctomycetaceae bacterium]|nr:hypothetical protein [Planctomycetaceae bacterium]